MNLTVRFPRWLLAALLLAGLLLLGRTAVTASAARGQVAPVAQGDSFHPTFPLLDEDGRNVLESGKPLSTMQTCGACHDTEFIAGHSFHADAGLAEFGAPGAREAARAWDESPGSFGRWNPLGYRNLSSAGDGLLDLGTAAWIQVFGARHVGGGPAVYSRAGVPLAELAVTPGDPETHVLDSTTGEVIAWDWSASGVVEMNCLLCHLVNPDNDARVEQLKAGNFAWANSATLVGTGVIASSADGLVWNPAAFDENGNVLPSALAVQDPESDNCGLCHGLVQDDLQEPVVVSGCSPERMRTITTGQIVSPERLADTGMNLDNKAELTRSWDVHAERLVSCTDCHYSLNNPVYYQESDATRPGHLLFDPRRIEIGEYLYQPLHDFARGESAQTTLALAQQDTMRRCDSCHSIEATHTWLPYKEQHVEVLSCETCHVPYIYANALQDYDWTVLKAADSPASACRGLQGGTPGLDALVTGYEPVLLARGELDGTARLTPYNLVTTWFWVYDEPARPVRLIDLQAVYFEGDAYRPQVVDAFDADGDGQLTEGELRIDTPEKQAFVAGQLEGLGLRAPRIVGEIQPYSINHTVAGDEWATRECTTCHAQDSRLVQPIQLAGYIPGGVLPEFVTDSSAQPEGSLAVQSDGGLLYQPATAGEGLYVFGHDRAGWIDTLGSVLFVGVLLGISVHGGTRVYSSARRRKAGGRIERVYMYGVYERLWHWLQTLAIVALLFTGLIIHRPDTFGIFSFRYVVLVHNILAAILVANAFLALFYHLASGEIRQFLPRPVGFFDQAIEQARYYLGGIFKGAEHPFAKSPEKKLNPLQQITYFSILNVLLPLQVLTGLLMWGVQQWPDLAAKLGGLPFLAPFHSLVAWLFGSFIVLHVYLTTTGHTPLSSIRAMMNGWEDVELHNNEEEITS